ncbi:MAG: spore maturation protein [Clostridiales bacterium]|nr:spore maturation protein [Clostridiales bacterium]
MSKYIIPVLIIILLVFSVVKKVKPYNAFIEGAKQSIDLTFSIFPYLVGVLILSELFEISGLADMFSNLVSPLFSLFGIPKELTKLVIIKPFSGSGSLAILSDVYLKFGVDSYIARCASAIYGSSETVFFISSVYFAKSKNKKLFLPILISLIASFFSTVFACFICKIL